MNPAANANTSARGSAHQHPNHNLAPFFAAITSAASITLSILYAASIAISDHFAATQWLTWIPPWFLITAATTTLIPAAINSARSTRRGRIQRHITITASTLAAATLLHAGLIHRTFGNPLTSITVAKTTTPTNHLRIVVWNATDADPDQALNATAALNADLYIIAHRGRTRWTDQLAEQLSAATNTNAHETRTYKATEAWPATIITHLDITRLQTRNLALQELTPPPPPHLPPLPPSTTQQQQQTITTSQPRTRTQPGYVIAFELETTQTLNTPITVWLLDLPSDPQLHRMQIAKHTVEKLGGPAQPKHSQLQPPQNTLNQKLDHWASAPAGLARPHLLVGDFNIPINAASIRRITGDMQHAHRAAGTSLPGTWQRRHTLLHIDHAFTSRQLRAHNYRTPDPGTGTHRIQSFEITPRELPSL